MFRVALLSLLLFLACGQEDVFTVTLPCVPVEGSELDPCEDSHPGLRSSLGASEPSPLPEAPAPIANFFGDGDSIAATHLIVRATHLPNTTRCTASNPFRVADHQEGVLTGVGAPGYHCYIDARVNEFYVGSGPSQMTLMIWRFEYYREPHNEEFRQAMEMGLGAALEGREYVLFLGPSFDVSTEVWQIFGVWKVGLKPDSSVVAIHPKRDRWLAENPAGTTQHASALEMTLPTLSAALTAAHTERMQRFGGRIGAGTDLPMLQTSAGNLRAYYEEVGAYDEGEPEPAQPPPSCAVGAAGEETAAPPEDCKALKETAVFPTPTPEIVPSPEPTPTPEGDLGQAREIALAWVAANPDIVADLVVEAALGSEDFEDLPPIARATFGSLLQASVSDELGNGLTVRVYSVSHLSGTLFGAGFLVEGSVTGLGAVSAVEMSVPFGLMLDLDAEEVTMWRVSVAESTVTIELGG